MSDFKTYRDSRAGEPEFFCWKAMIRRCTNPNHETYRYYGGRGIVVCDRWRKSFWNFRSDIGPRPSPQHTLERDNNDGHYEPGNVRWATKSEQALNRRQRVRPISDALLSVASEWVPLRSLVVAGEAAGATYSSIASLASRLVRLGQMEAKGTHGSKQYRTIQC